MVSADRPGGGPALTVSRHPSYLPLELMACGAAVVAFDSQDFSWLLRSGENCLSPLEPWMAWWTGCSSSSTTAYASGWRPRARSTWPPVIRAGRRRWRVSTVS